MVKNPWLEPLEYHVVSPFNLSVGAGVSNRRLVDSNPISFNEVLKDITCEVCAVVHDDGVTHAKLIDDVKEELDSFLQVGLDDWLYLDPFGEFVHGHE